MKKKTVFCCEDSVDGIFSAIYDAWASRLGLGNVTLQAGGNHNYSLFEQYRQTETDSEKAASVADTIRQKMGAEDYRRLYLAALAQDEEKAADIFRTVVLGLAVLKKKRITGNLQEPSILRIFELSGRVESEAYRYRMFVRFRELENGVMCSEIEPENQILPLLGEHFSSRFPKVDFIITDRKHAQCLVHKAGKEWKLLKDTQLREPMAPGDVQRIFAGSSSDI